MIDSIHPDGGERARLEHMKRFIRSRGAALLRRPNITSVGIGYKQVNGKTSPEIALQFTVAEKLSQDQLRLQGMAEIPPTITFEGVSMPTDVVQRTFSPSHQLASIRPKPDRKTRMDPLMAGVSIAHHLSTAGTLGAVVLDRTTRAPLLLSNWHVLAGAKARKGDPIVQPGPYDDSDVDANFVGRLLRSHLGVAGDCAVATLEQRRHSAEQYGLDTVIETLARPELGDLVIKSGRTTGVTVGIVSRIDALFRLEYDGRGEEQIGGFEINASADHPAEGSEISKGGDSGAMWMAATPEGKPTGMAVGLHFGGDADGFDGEFALACYASSVFEKLQIEPLGSARVVEKATVRRARAA